MNERLKGILRTAWNEPRHFFFWLIMLSMVGYAAVWLGADLTGPSLAAAFILVGCVLCFVIGVPAFLLAWIPPVRRLFAWLLARRLLVLACLATLVALFYAVEDWRGRTAWQDYKRKWEARGEQFDPASFIPPPVPANENFFETPLWQGMHFVQTNGVTVWRDTNWQEHALFPIYGPKTCSGPWPSLGEWAKAQPVELAAWQGFYRGTSNAVAQAQAAAPTSPREAAARQALLRRYGLQPGRTASLPTNYFPVAPQPQTPAADVLLALSKFQKDRQLLIAAAARPKARFWVNYDAGPVCLLPHLARLKACALYLDLHAEAALKAGERKTALEDVKLSFRLIQAIRDEPILISHLVRIAMLHIALQPVWEGLAERQWTTADLSVIEGELSKLDFLADYEFAMRGERTRCELWAVDYAQKWGIGAFENIGSSDSTGSASGDLDHLMGEAVFKLVPAGWFDQNKLSLCRLHERYLLPVVDMQRRLVSPDEVSRAESACAQIRPRPYDILSVFLLPSAGVAERFAYAQTSVDLAGIACALEGYRQAHGQFPESLVALAPKFIEKLPHDVINGQPLKYHRTDDGEFVLYSVGWNETDDGGKVWLFESGQPNQKKGDWVWRYPAK
jgi:hypothetical protein